MKNATALLAGAASLLLAKDPQIVALAALLLLELLLQMAAAMRQHQHIVSRIDPFLWRVLLYAGLLVLAALVAPVAHLPSVQGVATILLAAEASAVLQLLEKMGPIPAGIIGKAPPAQTAASELLPLVGDLLAHPVHPAAAAADPAAPSPPPAGGSK